MYRQGDVLLIEVQSIPQDACQEKGQAILAHGEVTGHDHRIKDRSAKVLKKGSKRYLRLAKGSVLEHEEHGHLTIPKGDYEIIVQREYAPEAIRNVAD